MTKPVQLIGVLDNGTDGLSPAAQACIKSADLIIGAARTLGLFKHLFSSSAQLRDLGDGMTKAPQWINDALGNNLKVVVLATGDPLCHGIAKYLIAKLGHDQCEVVPNVSTIQLAFARLGLAWQDAVICSVHGKDAGPWTDAAGPEHGLYPVLDNIRHNDLVAMFTGPTNTPDRIAQMLIQMGLAQIFSISIARGLLTDAEKIWANLPLEQAAKMEFANPNIVILQRIQPDESVVFGLADERYAQRKPDKGLITKCEVRAVSLAKMQLRRNSIVWDIGAASGSVGLEAAQICHKGFVFAIEKNAADIPISRENQQQMQVTNYRVQHGKAPQLLDSWPDPDAVFFGGSGGELAQLITLCLGRLSPGGKLVMNFVTLENLSLATDTLKKINAQWDVLQLQASRSQPILHMHRMAAENPVWIVSASLNSEKNNIEGEVNE